MVRAKRKPAAAAAANELAPLHWRAMYKASEKKAEATRNLLDVGAMQPVDFTVRVHGALDVAPNPTAPVKESLKAELLLGAVLGVLSAPMRSKVFTQLSELAEIYRAGEELATDAMGTAMAIALKERFTREVTPTKRGPVTGSIRCELL